MYKYTILTYNFGNYEIMREVINKQDDVEYIYVTDDKSLESSTWNIVYDDSLDGKDVFDKCYSVRFNPFKYCSTDICFRIDASIQLVDSLDKIVDDFISGNYDVAFMTHHCYKTLFEEYNAWVTYRGYDINQMYKNISFFTRSGYDCYNYNSLYTGTFTLQKKCKKNDDINRLTYATLKYLGNEDAIERNDQIVFTYIINKYYENNLNIMPISPQITETNKCIVMVHGKDDTRTMNIGAIYNNVGYVFNKEVTLMKY